MYITAIYCQKFCFFLQHKTLQIFCQKNSRIYSPSIRISDINFRFLKNSKVQISIFKRRTHYRPVHRIRIWLFCTLAVLFICINPRSKYLSVTTAWAHVNRPPAWALVNRPPPSSCGQLLLCVLLWFSSLLLACGKCCTPSGSVAKRCRTPMLGRPSILFCLFRFSSFSVVSFFFLCF
jgi:hypothetical protein